MGNRELEKKMVVGAKVKIGPEYSKENGFKAGEVVELVLGYFEHDNGLNTGILEAPSVWCEQQQDWDSIYHLFGNDLEDFKDCEIVEEKANG